MVNDSIQEVLYKIKNRILLYAHLILGHRNRIHILVELEKSVIMLVMH